MNFERIVILGCGLFVLGCGGGDAADAPDTGNSTAVAGTDLEPDSDSGVKPEAPPATVGESGVELKILGWDEIEKLIAGHRGKIVVVDLWSMSCVPCMKEFPGLVDLHKLHHKDVACVSLSCDYSGIKAKPPETYRDKVHSFLAKQEATFDNVLSSLESDELLDKYEVAAPPAVFVYGRNGKLIKRINNEQDEYADKEKGKAGFTYEDDITPFVEGLIGKQSPKAGQ